MNFFMKNEEEMEEDKELWFDNLFYFRQERRVKGDKVGRSKFMVFEEEREIGRCINMKIGMDYIFICVYFKLYIFLFDRKKNR